ncbi:MAG: methyltransferase, partial [Treponema sp.]|nr:methyltransferase [Treponema sp.]
VNRFYATFIPGLQDFIAEVVKDRLPDVKIIKLLDGACLFETETSYDKLNFFCFNNIFAVIGVAEGKVNLESDIKKLLGNNGELDVISNNSKNFKTFRIVVSNENVPAAISENIRQEAEQYISRISGLKVNRTLPDTEFWFLHRSENFTVFMKRLTLRSSWEKTLHKGELPPPLAWTLCRLTRLSHTDTVLDPFCGYGSIPEAAIKYFHITNFIACDNNSEAVAYTTAKLKNKFGFVMHKRDFSELCFVIPEKSIDIIITDPPWGQFSKMEDNNFTRKMFDIFGKIIKDGGRIVMLYANTDDLLKSVPDCFKIKNSIPILLSGRKSVIYEFVYSNN